MTVQKIAVTALLLTATVFCAATNADAELKIGFVRSSYILQNYEPYMSAVQEFEEYQTAQQQKMESMNNELMEKYNEYQQQSSLMDQTQRTSLEQEIMEMENEFAQYQQNMTRQGGVLEQKWAELVKPALDQANAVISQVRKREGYTLILDGDADAVVDADESLDISDMVLEKLQDAE